MARATNVGTYTSLDTPRAKAARSGMRGTSCFFSNHPRMSGDFQSPMCPPLRNGMSKVP